MKNLDADFYNALINARETGIVPRRFIYITAKRYDNGTPAFIGLWNGDEDVTISVTDAFTGIVSSRIYYGSVNIRMPVIPRVSDMTIQNISVEVSNIAAVAQVALREYNLRLAKVQIHDVLLNPHTRDIIGQPAVAFVGEVQGAPIVTGAVGESGSASIKMVSDAISMLERTNPRKSSYEGQKKRDGDEWNKYASTVATWKIVWGGEK